MEEFRRLTKEDLHEILSVVKESHDYISINSFITNDIINSFNNNQIYKLELYGFFRGGKLVNFSGIANQPGIGGSYEFRLCTTLPEFREMGYGLRAIERRIAIISTRERDYKAMIQVSSKNPKLFKNFGFKETGYVSRLGYIHLIKEIH